MVKGISRRVVGGGAPPPTVVWGEQIFFIGENENYRNKFEKTTPRFEN